MDVSNSLPPKPEAGIRPYLWTLDMLTMVQQSKIERLISDMEIAHLGQGVLKMHLQQLSDDFRWTMKSKLDIEIHPDDLVVHREDEFASLGVRLRVHWQPSTHNVQFRAGPGEGWIGYVGDLGVAYDVPVGQHQKAFPDPEITEPFETVKLVPYVMSGWNEKERCWVFMPQGVLF